MMMMTKMSTMMMPTARVRQVANVRRVKWLSRTCVSRMLEVLRVYAQSMARACRRVACSLVCSCGGLCLHTCCSTLYCGFATLLHLQPCHIVSLSQLRHLDSCVPQGRNKVHAHASPCSMGTEVNQGRWPRGSRQVPRIAHIGS